MPWAPYMDSLVAWNTLSWSWLACFKVKFATRNWEVLKLFTWTLWSQVTCNNVMVLSPNMDLTCMWFAKTGHVTDEICGHKLKLRWSKHTSMGLCITYWSSNEVFIDSPKRCTLCVSDMWMMTTLNSPMKVGHNISLEPTLILNPHQIP